MRADRAAGMDAIEQHMDDAARSGDAARCAGTRELHVEPASLSDLGAVLAIERASFSSPWTEKMLRAEIEGNPFARFILARQGRDREILGYVCYWVVFDELRIMNVAVAPRARRQGIARRLVEHALAEGRARGARRGLLEVRASNGPALSLYGRLGFARTAFRRNYYSDPKEDAILMELSWARPTI